MRGCLSCCVAALVNRLGSCVAPFVQASAADNFSRDIFLGGNCGTSRGWRDSLAIPELEEHGFTYFNPQSAEWSANLIPQEVCCELISGFQ